MKIWLTKYCLSTKRIDEADITEVLPRYGYLSKVLGYSDFTFRISDEGKTWHKTREGAVIVANAMRDKKIASLRKQIGNFEKLKFED